MVRSMTGFGRGVTTTDDFQLTVEVRSVNHRFLEIHSKFPKEWIEIEMQAKKMLSQNVSRGKIDITINVKMQEHSSFQVQINWPVIEAYKEVKEQLEKSLPIKDKWSMQEILSIENAILYEKNEVPIESLKIAFDNSLKEACEQLIEMREREGKQLKSFLLQYKDELLQQIQLIRKFSPQAVEKYRVKLMERIKEITETDTFDDRILAEVALYAERVDISEELDRLESHFQQLVDTLNENSSIGRKLDFLMQEILREINTIGSKNQSTECSVAVVQSKTILEKMREQVQNIE
ncbi:Large subunit ribosomal protein L28 OS=Ureibacillus acetophenoni OX=614649 GN=SAMN05877842_101415 PE=3 SV=1 [Ureibacillus acetophenoni]